MSRSTAQPLAFNLAVAQQVDIKPVEAHSHAQPLTFTPATTYIPFNINPARKLPQDVQEKQMSDFTFNVALGREVEFYNRVNSNDPAASALKGVVLAAAGLEPDATLKDYATLAAILAGTTNEVTNTNYARPVWTDAELANYTIDNTLDEVPLFLPASTVFPNIAAGDVWAKFLTCYDGDTAAGTDSDIIPITAHDILFQGSYIIPNGTNITMGNPTGFVICDQLV